MFHSLSVFEDDSTGSTLIRTDGMAPWRKICFILCSLSASAQLRKLQGESSLNSWKVKSGSVCASGSPILNETPAVQLCHCAGSECQGQKARTLISSGIGAGQSWSGSYVALTVYVADRGTSSIQFQAWLR
eukprot:Skav220889  [mRNA]  locus=scaffold3880:6792:11612:+ [translate_table: standard]